MKKLFFSIIALLILSFSVQASDVLAIVNGYKITTDVAPRNFNDLNSSEKHKIVNRLIEKYLAANYALNTDIVNDPEYKKVLKHILNLSSKPKKSETLASAVKKSTGYTEEQLFSKKGLLAFDFILEKKANSMKPDEKVLREYYEKNKFKYDTPAMVELATIVVDSKEEAEKIMKELKGSKGDYKLFSSLAKKYSKAPDAIDGGYMGKIPISDLNEEISKYILPLDRGEHTKPIKTVFGYQIYYVINQIPAVNTTFDMVKERVKDEYIRKEVKKWAFDTIHKLKNSAKIELKID
ncbi:foldase protein PrsA [Hydrogenimonas thermophila]|uniref:peptidylprolyl isomerase n=1 Tax=Hydrogenimonas thermophila TaxID=223786 RepID=A0A1I5L568_9BACT|nr:peptidyl-prolyl cis-trans isomerase [Hydrogenimonas thermophila]SFO92459.1 foldase protein PrsA [Hydrogenimonas thermophila]